MTESKVFFFNIFNRIVVYSNQLKSPFGFKVGSSVEMKINKISTYLKSYPNQ